MGLKLGTIKGIPIRVHVSLLIVLPLIAFLFGETFRRAAEAAGTPPSLLGGSPYLWGLGVAVALFAAVLVHELAHSLYALRRGGAVRGITLMMIGGVSQIARPPKGARAEAVMAAVGPLTSLVLGGAFYGVYALVGGRVSANLQFALFYLAYLNLVLGVFNLIPAFPMDGGRIVRSLLSPRFGKLRATQVAAALGKTIAAVLAVLALFSFNLFLFVVAAFVFLAAGAEAQQESAQAALADLRVGELMGPATSALRPDQTVGEAAELMARARQLSLPVVDDGGVRGIVSVDDVERMMAADRGGAIAPIVRAAPTLGPADDARRAWELLGEADVSQLAVVDAGQLVGMLSREDLARAIRLRQMGGRREGAGWLRQHREAST